jgi:hypothetical protein
VLAQKLTLAVDNLTPVRNAVFAEAFNIPPMTPFHSHATSLGFARTFRDSAIFSCVSFTLLRAF